MNLDHQAAAARRASGDGLADEIVEIGSRYYILATSSLAETNERVLKHGETFVVVDPRGDIKPVGLVEEGLYHDGTRFLSGLLLRIGSLRPLLLSSTVKDDNSLIAVDLTNPDLFDGDQLLAPHGTVHIERTQVLWEAVYHERVTLRNFGLSPIVLPVVIRFDADYADIFEVRGVRRARRGTLLRAVVEDGCVRLGYQGLDGVVRHTYLNFDPTPLELAAGEAQWALEIPPGRERSVQLSASCQVDADRSGWVGFEEASQRAADSLARERRRSAAIQAVTAPFNVWIERSQADLSMMTSETPQGPLPYAGVPWYSAPFGRDSVITALQTLWVDPQIARGTLRFLAAHQADAIDRSTDAQPGKIVHEMRGGEMAALGEVPFRRYYGSHDATPLFVMLVAAYYRRTADRALVEELWPNVERALAWIDEFGDLDGDGFVEYRVNSETGLVQQGWKDSWDSIFHADGRLAEHPIAPAEIQGYVYAAWTGAADLAELLGRDELAASLRAAATRLQARFDEAFWDEELETYALALDGRKEPCRVRASNAGQCLFTGIVPEHRAKRLAATILSPAFNSGWGIRTLAAGERRYNPLSYHNGSVWPHDNALIALGLARYGMTDRARVIADELYDASQAFDLARLPELFCGFTRRAGEQPVRYPVACSPQAWASGAVFMLLEACLGLEIDAPLRQVRFTGGTLPMAIGRLRIDRLRVGDASLDLVVRRDVSGVSVEVARRDANVEVLLRK